MLWGYRKLKSSYKPLARFKKLASLASLWCGPIPNFMYPRISCLQLHLRDLGGRELIAKIAKKSRQGVAEHGERDETALIRMQ